MVAKKEAMVEQKKVTVLASKGDLKLQITFNPYEAFPDYGRVMGLVSIAKRCKNEKTQRRFLISAMKLWRRAKIDKSQIRVEILGKCR